MKRRAKNLWLPGIVTSFASVALLGVLDRAGVKPLTIFISVGQTLYLDLFWLLALPLLGALGAWWSKRAGGGPRERALAGIFPASPVAPVVMVCLGAYPVALVIDSHVSLRLLSSFGLGLLNYSLIPGVALFLGALPFLKQSSQRAIVSRSTIQPRFI
ncbi:MAG TPA: hypothetical protein VKM93_17755 [Terriglobia bacterium]|nr:hypothetical protein [Terriglobia bacterium]